MADLAAAKGSAFPMQAEVFKKRLLMFAFV